MTQVRNSFDDQTLGVLESVLDEVCRELSSAEAASEAEAQAVTREQLAKLLIKHAQNGESDPVVLRDLVLNGIGRQ
jgi:hypothetical protein